jgi:hypothetical protein
MRYFPTLRRVCAWLALAGAAATASAQDNADPPHWVPVDGAALERMRGGFTTGSGLAVSFGIERLVTINGDIVARTSVQIADLNHLSVDQAQQTSAALSAVKLVQNGSDNIYLAAMSSQTLGGTVIQNSLNDQVISSQTVISSTVNSVGLLRALNFQASLGDALARAAAVH